MPNFVFGSISKVNYLNLMSIRENIKGINLNSS